MSTDGTRAIAAALSRTSASFERAFTTHAEQWNFGLEQTGIATEWVLALDADYVLTDDVDRELQALQPDAGVAGYRASFDYCIDGQPLRGAAYPPVTVLYRRARGRYEQDGHTQRVRLDGAVRPLTAPHPARRPQVADALVGVAGALHARSKPRSSATAPARRWGWPIACADGSWSRRRRCSVYCYFVRGGILDGRAGLFYALQRARRS